MAPKISIIMTTYNVDKTIEKSISSVFEQTLRELELICIDGDSTDGTCNRIKEYARKETRIKLFRQTRPSLGAAKNQGIESATGKFITFLDADDYYVDKQSLEKMYNACIKENVKVCGALRSTVFSDGTVVKENLHRSDCEGNPQGKIIRYADKQYDYHFHSYIYDREMIINSDARFAEAKAYDDTHFFIRAMLKAEVFLVIPVELYRYRCGPAYDWGMERANDAMKSLTDQLVISSENNLARLHWLTVQRINYEYGHIFEKNIRLGDITLLRDLILANEYVNPELLRQVTENPPPEQDYLEPMIHRKYADMPLRTLDCQYAAPYIFEPLWNILFCGSKDNGTKYERIEELTDELSRIKLSKTYKLSCLIAYFPQKVKRVFNKIFRNETVR